MIEVYWHCGAIVNMLVHYSPFDAKLFYSAKTVVPNPARRKQ
jgi:hypothetical protein